MAPTSSTDSSFDVIEDKQIPCLLNRRIDFGRYLLEKRLGSGGYSVVYLASDLFALPPVPGMRKRQIELPAQVAVKCLLHRTLSQKIKNAREVQLHRRACTFIRHGITRLHRTVEEDGLLFVILQLCDQGDLFRAITETKFFLGRDEIIKAGFLQLLDAVAEIHSLGIYHRDLKPENILLATAPCGGARLQLSDFGMATDCNRTSDFGCGSYYYMSPECLAGYLHNGIPAYSSRAADIWALGIILINMICSRLPWKSTMLTDPSFRRYMSNPRWLRDVLPISEEAYQFVQHIFSTHGNTKPLAQLRADFMEIETFYMSDEELEVASKSVRNVVSEWIGQPLVEREDIENMTDMDELTDHDLFGEDNGETTLKRSEEPSSHFSDFSDEDWATAPTSPALSVSFLSFPLSLSTSPELVATDTLALSQLEAQVASCSASEPDSVPEVSISIETSPSTTAYAESDQVTCVTSSNSGSSNSGVGELTDSGSSSSSGSASPFPITPETLAAGADTADVAVLSDDALGGSLTQWTRSSTSVSIKITENDADGRVNLTVLDKALAAIEEGVAARPADIE